MVDLAGSFAEDDLRSRAYSLYERFRPKIPAGRAGWGVKGPLDLELNPLPAAGVTWAIASGREADNVEG